MLCLRRLHVIGMGGQGGSNRPLLSRLLGFLPPTPAKRCVTSSLHFPLQSFGQKWSHGPNPAVRKARDMLEVYGLLGQPLTISTIGLGELKELWASSSLPVLS